MANKISVVIDVAVDRANAALGKFRKSVGDAEGATNKFKAGAGVALDSVKANAANLALVGGTALVAFAAKGVNEFNKLAIESGKLSDALGIPVDDMSRLIEVAGDLGIETSSLESTIGRMNRTAASTPEAFEAINAQIVKNADGTTNVNETFLATVDALNRIPDATKRAEAAQKIFGRSWQNIAELVGKGSDEIRKSLAEVSDQKIIDDKEVQDAREYRAAMDNLNDALQDISLVVGKTLTPALSDAADELTDVFGVWQALERSGPVELVLKVTGQDNIPGFLKSILDFGAGVPGMSMAVDMATGAIDKYQAATSEASPATRKYQEEISRLSDAEAIHAARTKESTEVVEDATKAAVDQKRAQEMTNRSIREAQRAVTDLMTAQLAAIDSNLGYRNAQAQAASALREYDEAAKEGKLSTEELDESARGAEGAALAQAAAAVQLAEDQAAANGSSLTAIEKNRIFKKELEALAAYSSGPLKTALEDYIATLGRIPKSVSTSVGINGRAPTIDVNGYRASGGPVSAGGTYVVGEDGPELLQMGSQSGNVIPNGATVGVGGSGGPNIVINMPPGSDGDSVVRALRQYVRKNGPIQGIT